MRLLTLGLSFFLFVGCKPAQGDVGVNIDDNTDGNTSVDPTCDDLDQDGGCDAIGEDDVITGNASNPATLIAGYITPGTVDNMWFERLGHPCELNDAHKVWTNDDMVDGYLAFNLNSADGLIVADDPNDPDDSLNSPDGSIAGSVHKPTWYTDSKGVSHCDLDTSAASYANLAVAPDDKAIVWNDDPQPGVPDVFLCLKIEGTTVVPGTEGVCQAQASAAGKLLNPTTTTETPTDNNVERVVHELQILPDIAFCAMAKPWMGMVRNVTADAEVSSTEEHWVSLEVAAGVCNVSLPIAWGSHDVLEVNGATLNSSGDTDNNSIWLGRKSGSYCIDQIDKLYPGTVTPISFTATGATCNARTVELP